MSVDVSLRAARRGFCGESAGSDRAAVRVDLRLGLVAMPVARIVVAITQVLVAT